MAAFRSALAWLWPRTLRARLAVLLLAIAMSGMAVFTLAISSLAESRLRELLADQQRTTVDYIAADIDSKVRLRLDGLAMIARRFPPAALTDPARATAFLAERRAIYNLFDGGLLLVKADASGTVADYPPLPGRLAGRYQDVEPYRAVAATRKAAIGPPRFGRFVKEPIIVFAVPVLADDGRLQAILAGVTTIHAANFLDLVARPAAGTAADFLVAAPRHGVFVTGTDRSFVLRPLPPPGANAMHDRYAAGFEGSGVASSSAGVEELTSARQVTSTGWFVVGRMPTELAFAPVRETRRLVFAGIGLLSLLIAATLLLLMRRAMRPLSDAADEMERMSRGEAVHALAPGGQDEIARLVESFNRLQDRIRLKEEELRENSETWRGIFDAVGEVILVQDEKGVILDANRGAERVLGLSRDALVGRTAGIVAIPDKNDKPVIQAVFRAALSGVPGQFEFCAGDGRGGEILLAVHLYPGRYFGRPAVIGTARDISETRRAERRFSTVFRTSPIPIAIARVADGRFVELNAAMEQLFGWRRDDMIGRTSVELGYWPSIAARRDWLAKLEENDQLHDHQVTLCDAGGQCHAILMSSSFIDFGGEPCVLNFLHDVTQERRAGQSLRLMAKVFSHAHDGMVITDAEACILDVNPAFTHCTGYTREEAVGRNPSFLQSGRHDREFFVRMWSALRQDGMWQGEIWNRKKDGGLIAEMLTISAVPKDAEGGDATRYVGVFTDITRLKETQAELEQLARYDALTALPNRALLHDRLLQAVAHVRRRRQLLAVCFLDLDGFKPINDNHGHEAGDHLLTMVARRLTETVRGGDTVARLGGDEFVILLTQVADLIEIETALQRLIGAVAQPCAWQGRVLQVSASVGVTVYPHDGTDPDALLRHADLAMYAAKQAGRNRYSFFDTGQDRQMREQAEHQADLRRALENGALVLHYQPKVHMRSGQVVGVEALIRWQTADGLKLPGQFLPFAEENDLIVDIGEWTLRTAAQQALDWYRRGWRLPVSVNIAARHLQHPDFVANTRSLLAAYAELPRFMLEFEILETSALADIERVRRIIEECTELGVRFALDDFGTGYSSLVYLRSLPAGCLKIDGTFVRDMAGDPHDLAIVEGVVGMGMAFGRTVVAEGVESEEQGQLLLQLGCEIAQGFGIARPMPAAAVPDWIEAFKPRGSWQSDDSAHWRREDFSLLAAEVDHRYWVEKVLAALEHRRQGRGASPPPLAETECRFGRWYDSEGRERYGSLPGFAALAPLHAAVHAAANEAFRLAEAGRFEAATAQAALLAGQRDAMVAALGTLRHAIVASRKSAAGNRPGIGQAPAQEVQCAAPTTVSTS